MLWEIKPALHLEENHHVAGVLRDGQVSRQVPNFECEVLVPRTPDRSGEWGGASVTALP